MTDSYMYGYGVFETMRTYDGKIFKLDEHVERLIESAKILEIEHKHENEFIRDGVLNYLNELQFQENRIKIVLTETELVTIFSELQLRPSEWYKTGIQVVTKQLERNFPEAKHMNCIPSLLGQKYAKENGVYETLMIDEEGIVREGTYTNVFWVKNETLYTTKTKILNGITRQTVFETSQDFICLKEIDTNIEEIMNADECFITNTTSEILPVVKINKTIIGDGKVGEWTKGLMERFKQIVKKYVDETI